jgi:hypothetical protein
MQRISGRRSRADDIVSVFLDDQEMKPAVSAPATIHFASLFDSGIMCDFQTCSWCSETIVLKFWGDAVAMISVHQRFIVMGWSLRYSDHYFEYEKEFLRLLYFGEMGITNVEGEERKGNDNISLKADDDLKSCYFTLKNPYNLPLNIFPLTAEVNHQTIRCYSGWDSHFIDIYVFDNCNANTSSVI